MVTEVQFSNYDQCSFAHSIFCPKILAICIAGATAMHHVYFYVSFGISYVSYFSWKLL